VGNQHIRSRCARSAPVEAAGQRLAVLRPGLRHRKVEAVLLAAHATAYVSLLVVAMTWQQVLVFFLIHQALFGIYLGCSFAPGDKGMPILAPEVAPAAQPVAHRHAPEVCAQRGSGHVAGRGGMSSWSARGESSPGGVPRRALVVLPCWCRVRPGSETRGWAHTPPGVAVKMPAGDPTPRRASSCRAEQMRPTHAACQATWVGLAVLDLMGMRNGRAGYIPGAQRPADPNPGEQRGTREAATAYAAASA
jgi:hypothetical protein